MTKKQKKCSETLSSLSCSGWNMTQTIPRHGENWQRKQADGSTTKKQLASIQKERKSQMMRTIRETGGKVESYSDWFSLLFDDYLELLRGEWWKTSNWKRVRFAVLKVSLWTSIHENKKVIFTSWSAFFALPSQRRSILQKKTTAKTCLPSWLGIGV